MVSKFLSILKEKWFNSHKFLLSRLILDKRYKQSELKFKSTFHFFNHQLDYTLAYYFAESEITKGNINKLLTNLLMALFTKKLLYKNANK